MQESNINDLKEATEKIINKGWLKSMCNGCGGGGITFEKLIGLSYNNFEIPDYNGIEIKTKVSNKQRYLALFCAAPDSFLFEIRRIYNTYGYQNDTNNRAFNVSIYSNRKTYYKGKYYQLKIDKLNKKIILCVYDTDKNLIDDNSSWSFNMLNEKIERKLKKLFLVFGERKYENKTMYFKYNKYRYYIFKDFESFIKAIEKGHIRISFSIGTFKVGKKRGKIYDHGTSFNICIKNINDIYSQII